MSAAAWFTGGIAAVGAAYLAGGAASPKRLPTPCRPGPRESGGEPGGRPRGRAWRRPRSWHALAAGAVLGLVAPILVPVPPALLVISRHLDRRRRQRRHEDAVVDALPDLVDLLRLTTLAGLPVSAALRAIGDRPGGVVGAALARAARLLDRGATTTQALTAVSDACGPPARGLVDALTDHDRYGTPLGPNLDRVAIEYRLRRRRRGEEAARRLPVTLLFPLVLTTLPAFVLLTIVPMLVGSFQMLRG